MQSKQELDEEAVDCATLLLFICSCFSEASVILHIDSPPPIPSQSQSTRGPRRGAPTAQKYAAAKAVPAQQYFLCPVGHCLSCASAVLGRGGGPEKGTAWKAKAVGTGSRARNCREEGRGNAVRELPKQHDSTRMETHRRPLVGSLAQFSQRLCPWYFAVSQRLTLQGPCTTPRRSGSTSFATNAWGEAEASWTGPCAKDR